MKKNVKHMALLLAVLMALSAFAGCSGQKDPEESKSGEQSTEQPISTAFVPGLDTTKRVTIDIASFFGNFEALDQVINHFNEFYPNVEINYDGYGDTSSEDFLKINPAIDIFMTSNERGYNTDSCVDLISAGVDVSAVSDKAIEGNKQNGILYSLPMSLTLKGLVVNKTLLAKEGLSVPETWNEFLNVLEALKQKGYTPIQGSNTAVATICYGIGMTMLNNDTKLLEAVNVGDVSGADALKIVFERVEELMNKGYFSAEINDTYPENNYEGSILTFFEGKVPFWACDTEKVSGMKKRESKSEAFTSEPFEYEFIYAPIGENGAYEYIEPWYGFAVNKDSDVRDYATEFLRFMAREEELNTLASVKGVPSVAKVSADTRYANLGSAKAELALSSNGTVPVYYGLFFTQTATELITVAEMTVDDALKLFAEKCAESSK